MNTKACIARLRNIVVVTAAICIANSPSRGDIPAFPLGGTSSEPAWNSFTGSRGWLFRHAGENPLIAITELGVYDSGGDGLMNSHEIGLWQIDGTLLASATVPPGEMAPLIDGYRYVSISPVVLDLGESAIVAGQFYAEDPDGMISPVPLMDAFGAIQYAEDIRPGAGTAASWGRLGIGADLPFPSATTGAPCEGCFPYIFWEVNFHYVVVPEPSVWLLVTLVLGYSVVYLRKQA